MQKIKKAKEELKDYVKTRIDDLRIYIDKNFENVDKRVDNQNSNIQETKNDVRTINERIDKILEILSKK